jgi:hypothetical protein
MPVKNTWPALSAAASKGEVKTAALKAIAPATVEPDELLPEELDAPELLELELLLVVAALPLELLLVATIPLELLVEAPAGLPLDVPLLFEAVVEVLFEPELVEVEVDAPLLVLE